MSHCDCPTCKAAKDRLRRKGETTEPASDLEMLDEIMALAKAHDGDLPQLLLTENDEGGDDHYQAGVRGDESDKLRVQAWGATPKAALEALRVALRSRNARLADSEIIDKLQRSLREKDDEIARLKTELAVLRDATAAARADALRSFLSPKAGGSYLRVPLGSFECEGVSYVVEGRIAGPGPLAAFALFRSPTRIGQSQPDHIVGVDLDKKLPLSRLPQQLAIPQELADAVLDEDHFDRLNAVRAKFAMST